MITIDDLMMSCGGDSGDDDGRQMLAMGDHHQLTAVSRIRTAKSSMLNRRRTGHARFRRGPVAAEQHASPDSDQPHPPAKSAAGSVAACEEARFSASASGTSSSLSLPSTSLTSLTVTAGGEGSVSNGRAQGRYLFQPASGGGGHHSAGNLRLPLAVSMQQQQDYSPGTELKNGKCHDRARSENDAGGKQTHGDRCHCSKKRKLRVKRMVRVPAISSRNADIPPDDYSWRKYGQKPIKGSPYPRGYYKCSTVRGCPARKHVERDPAEPAMLIVTYEGDHRHDEQQQQDRPAGGAHTEHTTTSS